MLSRRLFAFFVAHICRSYASRDPFVIHSICRVLMWQFVIRFFDGVLHVQRPIRHSLHLSRAHVAFCKLLFGGVFA